ncbi:MAG: radical SAM protein, partial [Porphyromonadaceae bacterium]|nr:radical SAM protein [Porphyromonadaceae bacterium]
NPNNVKGLIFRNGDGQLVFTRKREEIKNLDALPIPEYEHFGFREGMEYFKYAQQLLTLETFSEVRFAEIIGSRSCPFSCTFCYHPLGKTYRQRSLDHIFSEIDYLHKTFGVNVIAFCDELFSVNEARLLAFAERIKPYNIKWTANFRVSDVKRDLMKTLVDSGLFFATFGIESMNDDVLKSMKKHIKRSQIINALKVCRELRLECSGNIILGDPSETIETANESIEWWKQNPVYHVSMGFIRAVPDAPVYQYALEKGLIKNKLNHVRNLPLLNMSKMSNRQYYNLVLKVRWWNLMHTYTALGILVSTSKLDECYCNKKFYELKVRCPFCGCEQTHKKFLASAAPYLIISCSLCFAYFKIPQKQAFPSDYSVRDTAKNAVIKLSEAYVMRFSLFRNYRHVIKKILRKLI